MKFVCFAITLFLLLALSDNELEAMTEGGIVQITAFNETKQNPKKKTDNEFIIHFNVPCLTVQNFVIVKPVTPENRSYDRAFNSNFFQYHNSEAQLQTSKYLFYFKYIAQQQHSCSKLQRFNL